MKDSDDDQAAAELAKRGVTKEEYLVFKAINEKRWPGFPADFNPDDEEFVEAGGDDLEQMYQEVKKYGVTMEELRAFDKINRTRPPLFKNDSDSEIVEI